MNDFGQRGTVSHGSDKLFATHCASIVCRHSIPSTLCSCRLLITMDKQQLLCRCRCRQCKWSVRDSMRAKRVNYTTLWWVLLRSSLFYAPNALSWASFHHHHHHGHTSTAWQLLVHSTSAVQFNGNSVRHPLNELETIVLFIFFFFFVFPFSISFPSFSSSVLTVVFQSFA